MSQSTSSSPVKIHPLYAAFLRMPLDQVKICTFTLPRSSRGNHTNPFAVVDLLREKVAEHEATTQVTENESFARINFADVQLDNARKAHEKALQHALQPFLDAVLAAHYALYAATVKRIDTRAAAAALALQHDHSCCDVLHRANLADGRAHVMCSVAATQLKLAEYCLKVERRGAKGPSADVEAANEKLEEAEAFLKTVKAEAERKEKECKLKEDGAKARVAAVLRHVEKMEKLGGVVGGGEDV
jgi:hypothetical protein